MERPTNKIEAGEAVARVSRCSLWFKIWLAMVVAVAMAKMFATEAAQRALKNADCPPEEIDAVLVSTCTGYLCPGLTSYVSEQLGLRENIFALDLVGQGCGIGDLLGAGGREQAGERDGGAGETRRCEAGGFLRHGSLEVLTM